MKNIYPINITQENKEVLTFEWNDGHKTRFLLEYLRKECPCANCKGETILFKTYIPEKPEKYTEDMITLKSIIPVGNYAIQIVWKDGHDTGIYSWEYLRSLDNPDESCEHCNPNK